jgi:hypothetical protein
MTDDACSQHATDLSFPIDLAIGRRRVEHSLEQLGLFALHVDE